MVSNPFAAQVGGEILLRASCGKAGQLRDEERDHVVHLGDTATTQSSGQHFLISLAQSEHLGRRRYELGPEDPATWHFTISSEKKRCAPIKATPLDDTPGPEAELGKEQQWVDALGFLVNEDCSAVVIYFVNKATVITSKARSSMLYDLKLSF